MRALMLLEHFGLGVGAPLIKHLDSGIFEVRSHVGNNHQRVLLFHWHENYLVLLHGFTKKTQKTPPLEIERAKRYRADFLIRYSTDRILEILAEEEKQS
ncbi:phage-related protein [Croceifilum oryzae]|uniref:Phage-related protein n=1 Tax=Croceifilum oryzae TaxID=1553429 RepID=A0AAJ1TM84_9BACL|nr:phage-related protein [Croceifilum oryzae]